MALDTYSGLKAAVADFLNRSDLTDVIPDFITLCEARVRRTIRSQQTSILQTTIAAGDTSMALPADLTSLVSVNISGSTLGGRLTMLSHGDLLDKLTRLTTAGIPQYAAVVGEVIEFAPVPDADYTVDIEVEGPFVPLSLSATTNWLLTDHPDVYLYGSLAESAPYLKDDARIATWNGRFVQAMKEIEQARDAWRYPGQVNVPVPRTFADAPPR